MKEQLTKYAKSMELQFDNLVKRVKPKTKTEDNKNKKTLTKLQARRAVEDLMQNKYYEKLFHDTF